MSASALFLHGWLDNIKPGYGERFTAAFEDIGIEDQHDIDAMDSEMLRLLEKNLTAAGAKACHLKNIKAACKIASDGGTADAEAPSKPEHTEETITIGKKKVFLNYFI